MITREDLKRGLSIDAEAILNKKKTIEQRMAKEQEIYENETREAIKNLDYGRINWLLSEHTKNNFQFLGELDDLEKEVKEWEKRIEEFGL